MDFFCIHDTYTWLSVFNVYFRYNGSRPNDIYYYPNVIAHDSNTTCTIIWMTIFKVINCRLRLFDMTWWACLSFGSITNGHDFNLQEIERTGKQLNKVHIQLDNTCRENKNKFVAAFCAWLVEFEFVKELRLSFQPVG